MISPTNRKNVESEACLCSGIRYFHFTVSHTCWDPLLRSKPSFLCSETQFCFPELQELWPGTVLNVRPRCNLSMCKGDSWWLGDAASHLWNSEQVIPARVQQRSFEGASWPMSSKKRPVTEVALHGSGIQYSWMRTSGSICFSLRTDL